MHVSTRFFFLSDSAFLPTSLTTIAAYTCLHRHSNVRIFNRLRYFLCICLTILRLLLSCFLSIALQRDRTECNEHINLYSPMLYTDPWGLSKLMLSLMQAYGRCTSHRKLRQRSILFHFYGFNNYSF